MITIAMIQRSTPAPGPGGPRIFVLPPSIPGILSQTSGESCHSSRRGYSNRVAERKRGSERDEGCRLDCSGPIDMKIDMQDFDCESGMGPGPEVLIRVRAR